jgi:hypothetical protein
MLCFEIWIIKRGKGALTIIPFMHSIGDLKKSHEITSLLLSGVKKFGDWDILPIISFLISYLI